ncbi:hypothetical protein GCM10009682_58930 [Luedemannella flava]|uniref:Rho termination factor N-terminal domain-containing protein n=1 Tax=Luedemannella flava TaxID=349316 RepID=A0ABP4Z0L6_9ACTN
MSDVAKQSLAVLRRITEFLEYLPQDQVDDLAEGRARLTLIPWGSNDPVVPASAKPARVAKSAKAAPIVDVATVKAALDAAASRDEAATVLAPFGVGELRVIAAELGLGGVSKTPKAALAKQLVDFTAGARLSGAAIRGM